MPHILRVSVAAAALFAAGAIAQAADERPITPVTWEDILADAETTSDVLQYGMGVQAQRYSALAQINAENVKHLRPKWSFSFGDEKQRGQEVQAIIHDGVAYVTASYSRMFALDIATGKRLWKYEARMPEDIRPCCDVINRGAAIYGDKVFFGTLDASIHALDRKTGKVVWKKKFGDHKIGYTMTGAPTIVKDQKTGRVMLIHGSSGDEFGVIGKLYARDPDTGEEIWMRPMVEGHMGVLEGKESTPTGDPAAPSWPNDADGTKVEAWSHGGGAPWQSASFDVATNTIVIGAGNPAPWNGWARWPGDSLYTSGQAYVDPTSGELVGFYQHTPNDAWDFSGNNEIILYDHKMPDGTVKRAGAHADRNGFFYVTDIDKLAARGGEINKPTALLNAFPFVDGITWASRIDLETGRPVENEGQRPPLPKEGESKGATVQVSPPFLGGKNWNPMAYNPERGLFYVPANHWSEDYWTEHVTYNPGAAYLGQGFRIKRLYDDHIGTLRAFDPTTGEKVWEHKEAFPLWAGVLATGGDLVFTGTSDGYIKAFHAGTGEELWKFQTGSGIISCPVTFEMDGKQYLAFASGYGGAVPLWGGDMAVLTTQVSQGGSFWMFEIPAELAALK